MDIYGNNIANLCKYANDKICKYMLNGNSYKLMRINSLICEKYRQCDIDILRNKEKKNESLLYKL